MKENARPVPAWWKKSVVYQVNLRTFTPEGTLKAAEEKLAHYIEYFGNEVGMGVRSYQDVYSSDSTPFADRGIPAVSFARIAPANTATIHNSYDTMAVMKESHMQKDIAFICGFADRMANAARLPVAREIPQNMKDKLDIYLCRKRDKK